MNTINSSNSNEEDSADKVLNSYYYWLDYNPTMLHKELHNLPENVAEQPTIATIKQDLKPMVRVIESLEGNMRDHKWDIVNKRFEDDSKVKALAEYSWCQEFKKVASAFSKYEQQILQLEEINNNLHENDPQKVDQSIQRFQEFETIEMSATPINNPTCRLVKFELETKLNELCSAINSTILEYCFEKIIDLVQQPHMSFEIMRSKNLILMSWLESYSIKSIPESFKQKIDISVATMNKIITSINHLDKAEYASFESPDTDNELTDIMEVLCDYRDSIWNIVISYFDGLERRRDNNIDEGLRYLLEDLFIGNQELKKTFLRLNNNTRKQKEILSSINELLANKHTVKRARKLFEQQQGLLTTHQRAQITEQLKNTKAPLLNKPQIVFSILLLIGAVMVFYNFK